MAKITVNKPAPVVAPLATYTLELTESEAKYLYHVLAATSTDSHDTVYEAISGLFDYNVRLVFGDLVHTGEI